jgi:hypothetical protein
MFWRIGRLCRLFSRFVDCIGCLLWSYSRFDNHFSRLRSFIGRFEKFQAPTHEVG